MKKLVILFLIIICMVMLTSCTELEKKSGVIYAFSTYINITIYTDSTSKNDDCYKEIEKIFKDMSNLSDNFSGYDGINNIYTINHTSEMVQIDDRLLSLLDLAMLLKNQTDGYFNPFIGNLSMLYKELLQKDNLISTDIPTKEIIEEELVKMKNTTLEINYETNEVKKIGDGTIDLGGIAKGYAVKLVKEFLFHRGITTYLIDAGNSSITLGEKLNSTYYTVGVKGVDKFKMNVRNLDISTSSIKEQFIEYNGIKYHHIISPITGYPCNDYDTICLIGSDSALLDALTTAFMSMPLNAIQDICSKYSIDVVIFKNNELLYSTKEEHTYE